MPLATKRKVRKPMSAMTSAVMPTLIAADVGFIVAPRARSSATRRRGVVVVGHLVMPLEGDRARHLDELAHERQLRLLELFGRARDRDLALVEHRDAIGDAEGR